MDRRGHGKNVEAKPEAAHGQFQYPLDHKAQNNDAHLNVHACCSRAAAPAFLLFLSPTTLIMNLCACFCPSLSVLPDERTIFCHFI